MTFGYFPGLLSAQPPAAIAPTAPGPATAGFDKNIEGLRGIAALSVVYAHVFEFGIDPAFRPDGVLAHVKFSHLSVLLFFVLSGYVIGLTNKPGPFSLKMAGNYLKKRFVRLYPIYAVAILLTLVAIPETDGLKIFSNLSFLQFALTKSLKGNVVLWTLNFEVLYYLLFLGILWLRPNPKVLLALAFAVSNLGLVFPQVPGLLVFYASGWVFWLAGLYMAWYLPRLQQPALSANVALSFLLLLVANNVFMPGFMILNFLHLLDVVPVAIVCNADLVHLPVVLALFAAAAGRKLPFGKLLTGAAFALPLGVVAALYAMGKSTEHVNFLIGTACTLAACGLWFIRIPGNVLAPFGFVGSISYAVYLVHMPLAHLLRQADFPAGTPLGFALRLAVLLVAVLGLSYLLELKMQPWVRNRFFPRKAAKPQANCRCRNWPGPLRRGRCAPAHLPASTDSNRRKMNPSSSSRSFSQSSIISACRGASVSSMARMSSCWPRSAERGSRATPMPASTSRSTVPE
jgi:peptidoglycan/LPS O-acetylase OafA/YrhL